MRPFIHASARPRVRACLRACVQQPLPARTLSVRSVDAKNPVTVGSQGDRAHAQTRDGEASDGRTATVDCASRNDGRRGATRRPTQYTPLLIYFERNVQHTSLLAHAQPHKLPIPEQINELNYSNAEFRTVDGKPHCLYDT